MKTYNQSRSIPIRCRKDFKSFTKGSNYIAKQYYDPRGDIYYRMFEQTPACEVFISEITAGEFTSNMEALGSGVSNGPDPNFGNPMYFSGYCRGIKTLSADLIKLIGDSTTGTDRDFLIKTIKIGTHSALLGAIEKGSNELTKKLK